MNSTAQHLYESALQLSVTQRAELAARLITSLDPVIDDDAAPSWDVEIQQRLNDIDSKRVPMIPWEQARRVIRGETDGPLAD